MQLDFSSARSLLPDLQPLFLGGSDTTMLYADPADWTVQWEERRDRILFRSPSATSSRTITARAMRRFIQHRWAGALILSLDQAGFQSHAIWASRIGPGNLSPSFKPVAPSLGTPGRPGLTAASLPPPISNPAAPI